ncbi:uncharacterized protein LOC109846982 [Asparagus officinalis]|uniref:uncharacterized protein LOC109846982 n=1 Tax=Asparagus officinalis TaxID=4686 RepID=UPI00098E5124|nr:uncharacterized protein LOC109846982 [Asparagus officinalis]
MHQMDKKHARMRRRMIILEKHLNNTTVHEGEFVIVYSGTNDAFNETTGIRCNKRVQTLNESRTPLSDISNVNLTDGSTSENQLYMDGKGANCFQMNQRQALRNLLSSNDSLLNQCDPPVKIGKCVIQNRRTLQYVAWSANNFSPRTKVGIADNEVA